MSLVDHASEEHAWQAARLRLHLRGRSRDRRGDRPAIVEAPESRPGSATLALEATIETDPERGDRSGPPSKEEEWHSRKS
jgi:hypothetical protein